MNWAFDAGQPTIPVHIFPFEMTDENLAQYSDSEWFAFWQELKPAWEMFENLETVPEISVRSSHYVITQ